MAAALSWRLLFPANAATGASVAIAEIEMRESYGGSNVAVGGSSGASAGATPSSAFDGNTGTSWSTSDTGITWIEYIWDFPDYKSIIEWSVKCVLATSAPNQITFQYYDTDNAVYVDVLDSPGLTWTDGETKVFQAPYDEVLVDGIMLVDTVDTAGSAISVNAGDTLSMSVSEMAASKRITQILADEVDLAPTLSGLVGLVLTEHLTLAPSLLATQSTHLTIADTLSTADRLVAAWSALVAEGVGVAPTQQVLYALQVVEQLGLADALAPSFIYGRSVNEVVQLVDSLANFFGASVSEGIGANDAMVASAQRISALSDGIGVASTATPSFVLRVTVDESMELVADDALTMILNGTIAEGIEIAAAFFSRADNITTWAMNTRTGAVTEYSNYTFNSFAQLGNTYLGASENGLYTLIGDDDDGTDIIAQLRSGIVEWAGSRYTMFKGVYLAARGGGDYVLRLETGDGKSYDYGFTARDMQTTRIRTGKGLRARYFTFELISTGQDFDIDTLEFVPVIADRRI